MFQALPLFILEGDQHPVAEEGILLPVRRQQRLRRRGCHNLAQCIVISRIVQPRIQLNQLRPERARQHHLPVIPAPQKTVGAKVLTVVGID